jgi:hypothetical protein
VKLLIPKGEVSEATQESIEEILKDLKSTKTMNELKDRLKCAHQFLVKFDKARVVDPKLLREPITL